MEKLISIDKVYCATCHEWYNIGDVKILNCEKEVQKEDTITFKCPVCNQIKKSQYK